MGEVGQMSDSTQKWKSVQFGQVKMTVSFLTQESDDGG